MWVLTAVGNSVSTFYEDPAELIEFMKKYPGISKMRAVPEHNPPLELYYDPGTFSALLICGIQVQLINPELAWKNGYQYLVTKVPNASNSRQHSDRCDSCSCGSAQEGHREEQSHGREVSA